MSIRGTKCVAAVKQTSKEEAKMRKSVLFVVLITVLALSIASVVVAVFVIAGTPKKGSNADCFRS